MKFPQSGNGTNRDVRDNNESFLADLKIFYHINISGLAKGYLLASLHAFYTKMRS
jgi:hypothetical protein